MLALTGVSHKTASLVIREGLALDAQETVDLLPMLGSGTASCVILSTCNRTELYVSGPDALDVARARACELAVRRGLSVDAQSAIFYSLQGDAAVRHLYRVAAGLESLVLGEDQILGQVRSALHLARRARTADAILIRLFESAVSAGRKLRVRSGVVPSPVSVSAAAVDLAISRMDGLRDRPIVVVSTGDAGALTVRSLVEHGARRVTLVGRTLSRTQKLAGELGVAAASIHGLLDSLRTADVAVSATGARGYLIDAPMVAAAMQTRPERPLLLIDLAVPRDIDPVVAALPNVNLFDIDTLQPVVGERYGRGSECESRDAQLEAAVESFMHWWRVREIVPTIAALRRQAERVRGVELEKTLARLPGLNAEERRRVDALTSAIVNKLLHQPIVALKESDGSGSYLESVRELFALPLESE
jgi:glutamyl-tRNA reductase